MTTSIDLRVTQWAQLPRLPAQLSQILTECGIMRSKSAEQLAARTLRALGWRRRQRANGRYYWAPRDATPTPAAPTPAAPTLDDQREARRDQRSAREARASLRRALDRIETLEATRAAYERFTAEPIRRIEPITLHAGLRPAVAVALLSDVHAEERVWRTEAIPNEYDLAIAKRRTARFFAAVVWLLRAARRSDFSIDALVLWLGGDFISGAIHDELLERAEVPPAEATLTVRDWLVSGMQYLLAELPDVRLKVPCSVGNHSRTTQRVRPSTGYGHSWEWLLYQMIGHAFRDDPRVQVHATPDEMQYVEVFDFTLAFHHGHNIRYNGGIGGITIPAVKAMHRWQAWRECDYYHFGHFHTRLDLDQIAFNGSVIGPSPYGMARGYTPSPPVQSFYLLDAKRGKTGIHPVWVAE